MSKFQQSEESKLNHHVHCNINYRQEKLREENEKYEFEYYLYEAKRAHEAMAYTFRQFEQLRTGNLPKTFQPCHLTEPEEVIDNKLTCALGVNPVECPILIDLFKDTESFTPELIDKWKADICIGHILQECSKHPSIDTSEGYIIDETDKMFWERVTQSMMMTGESDNDK